MNSTNTVGNCLQLQSLWKTAALPGCGRKRKAAAASRFLRRQAVRNPWVTARDPLQVSVAEDTEVSAWAGRNIYCGSPCRNYKLHTQLLTQTGRSNIGKNTNKTQKFLYSVLWSHESKLNFSGLWKCIDISTGQQSSPYLRVYPG